MTQFRRRLLNWYRANRRNLPWRAPAGSAAGTLPDPYLVLVSETMLQQTQVATVVPYFQRFMNAFPTLDHLAAADEQAVLARWQGLGYYTRARNLRSAARVIVETAGGTVPKAVKSLIALPGIGRYTAGAIASLAFDRRAPILDGNVARVLCRLDLVTTDPRDRQTNAALWLRAEEILPRRGCGDFNSALMELGATICTPRSPKCLFCPVQSHCLAFAAGKQNAVPPARTAKPTPLEQRIVCCLTRGHGSKQEWLIERRPATGRWAGMWQFPTLPRGEELPPWKVFAPRLDAAAVPMSLGLLRHQLTHRRYEFDVWTAQAARKLPINSTSRWIAAAVLIEYPLPKPHVEIARRLAATSENPRV